VVGTGGGLDVVTTGSDGCAVGVPTGPQAATRTTPQQAHSAPAQCDNDLDTRETLSRTIAETDSGYVAKPTPALHQTISGQLLDRCSLNHVK
jgi:hypothetical protein